MNDSCVVKEYDINQPGIHETVYLLDDIIEDCRNEYLHTFEYKLVYDIKYTNVSNKEDISFTITHRSMEFRTEFYGSNKKNQKCSKKWFYI